MSAIPTSARVAVEPRRLAVPPGLAVAGRTAMLLAMALLVPGEAGRIGASIPAAERHRSSGPA